jgi:hypothetical protein
LVIDVWVPDGLARQGDVPGSTAPVPSHRSVIPPVVRWAKTAVEEQGRPKAQTTFHPYRISNPPYYWQS